MQFNSKIAITYFPQSSTYLDPASTRMISYNLGIYILLFI